MPKIIIIVGEPCSGKTTLGIELAKKLDAVFIDRDTVMNPMLDFILEREGYIAGDYDNPIAKLFSPTSYEASENIVKENHQLGKNCILVAPYSKRQEENWLQDLTLFFGVEPIIIWNQIDEKIAWERRHERGTSRDTVAINKWETDYPTYYRGAPNCKHIHIKSNEITLEEQVSFILNVINH